jgi:hypothetical protein
LDPQAELDYGLFEAQALGSGHFDGGCFPVSTLFERISECLGARPPGSPFDKLRTHRPPSRRREVLVLGSPRFCAGTFCDRLYSFKIADDVGFFWGKHRMVDDEPVAVLRRCVE